MHNTTNILYALGSFCSGEDGTYELYTHQPVELSTGYQVSFVRPEAFNQISSDEWDTLTEYCCGYLSSNIYIGVYCGEAEVSFHTDDLSMATYIMKQFNQESILDWGAKQAFPEDSDRWFLVNQYYDKDMTVNYHEILEQI